jgi:hypothetical protein
VYTPANFDHTGFGAKGNKVSDVAQTLQTPGLIACLYFAELARLASRRFNSAGHFDNFGTPFFTQRLFFLRKVRWEILGLVRKKKQHDHFSWLISNYMQCKWIQLIRPILKQHAATHAVQHWEHLLTSRVEFINTSPTEFKMVVESFLASKLAGNLKNVRFQFWLAEYSTSEIPVWLVMSPNNK